MAAPLLSNIMVFCRVDGTYVLYIYSIYIMYMAGTRIKKSAQHLKLSEKQPINKIEQ